jgi:hypothetical protein
VTIGLDEMVVSVFDSVDGSIPVETVIIDSVSSDEPENVHEDWEDWFDWLVEFFQNLDHNLQNTEYDESEIQQMYFTEDGAGNHLNCFWGDGYTLNDIVFGPECRSIDLRAERLGSGNGRVYSVYLSVSDSAGNKADTVYTVSVPHNRKRHARDDGPVYTVINECAPVTAGEENMFLPKRISEPAIPDKYDLLQNYPNPFNPDTEIRFELPDAGFVEIRIYNMLGQEIRLLTSRMYEAGYHTVGWHGRDNRGSSVASGIYIYEMRTNGFVMHKKLVLAR